MHFVMFVNVSTYNSIPLTKQRLDYALISVLRAYSLTFDSRDTPPEMSFLNIRYKEALKS